MQRQNIFLSYRRDDSPGYVSRLEDELERAFGDGRVFRDATDIPGGTKWRNVIDANLHSSAALILFIGPRWEQIWHERKDDDVNYVALELKRARELDVPIIPLTLNGTTLSPDLDLGEISFVLENQFHDISDRQGRWKGDFARLVSLLEGFDGIGRAQGNRAPKPPPEKKQEEKSGGGVARTVGIVAAVVAALVVWAAMTVAPDVAYNGPDDVVFTEADPQLPPRSMPGVAPPAVEPGTDYNEPVPQPAVRPPAEPTPESAPPAVPEITGTWQGADGTIYFVLQYADGSFAVESPGYGSGEGRFIAGMPNKFEIVMYGIGRGEFSVSATGDRAMGWILVDGQQQYDTLTRVE